MPSWWRAKPPRPELAEIVHAPPTAVTGRGRAADRPRAGLGVGPGLRALSGVAEGLAGAGAAGASGLRPVSAEAPDPDEVRRRLGELSDAARGLLEHVADHGGEATAGSARHTVLPEDAATPAEELLARRLLVPRGGGVVVLPGRGGPRPARRAHDPRAGGRRARGGDLGARPGPGRPGGRGGRLRGGPPPRAAARPLGHRTRRARCAAAASASATSGPPRSSSTSTSRRRRCSSRSRTTPGCWRPRPTRTGTRPGCRPTATTCGPPSPSPSAGPTSSAPGWTAPGCRRWSASRDAAGKTWNALAPELAAVTQVESRRMALNVLAELPAGEVPATGTGLPSLVARVAWLRPRRPRSRADQVAWAVDRGGDAGGDRLRRAGVVLPRPAGRRRRRPRPRRWPAAARAGRPRPDPGRPDRGRARARWSRRLARTLQLLADVESRGGATVYRFTPASVRRALDSGWAAAEVHDFVDGCRGRRCRSR